MRQPGLPFADPGEPTARRMPRLSEQLAGPASPDRCQACGGECDLDRWREHDDADRPEQVVVVLCSTCSDRLIEKHPRLYGRMDRNEPHPGSMTLCIVCRHREGLRCTQAKFNGGPGVNITATKPQRMHLLCSPRKHSGFHTYWPKAPEACDRREIGVFNVVGEDD